MEFLVCSALMVRKQVGIVAAHEIDKPPARHKLQQHIVCYNSVEVPTVSLR